MRLISYNILDGGEGRADPIAETILAQKPDIVALVEADDPASLDRIAKRLNMDYIHAPGKKKSAALLSRWPIIETINHAGLHPDRIKSMLEATVQQPHGERWTVGVVHLHAHATEADEAIREKEIAFLMDTFAPHRSANRPHLLVGDFNANSPIQAIDPALCKPSTREAWKQNGGDLPRRVVRTMLDAGYVDSLQQFAPKLAASAGSFSTQYPGQRVDYIFTWGIAPARIAGAWIEQDRLAKYASDHFPIGIDIT